jgi:predicted GH43/DUF377 family glycosyl hydrolase
MAPAVRVGISARPLHERNDGTLQLMAAVDNHSQVYRVMARSRGKGDPLELTIGQVRPMSPEVMAIFKITVVSF